MALKPIPKTEHKTPTRDRSEFRRLLYVEDEDLNWFVTERRLREDYDIERARDARELCERVRAQVYDLVLMDIQLSGSSHDGVQLTKHMRGTLGDASLQATPPWTRDVPIVFVTAYGSIYTKDDLVKVGGDDAIPKPVNFVVLSGCITRLLLRGLRNSSGAPPKL
jgi:CheY-like chemotaxis protein